MKHIGEDAVLLLTDRECLYDDWVEDSEDAIISPKLGGHWEQVSIFPKHEEDDYSISVTITPIDGEDRDNVKYLTAGVLLRYSGKDTYYYAGIGGFGSKFFLGLIEIRDGKAVHSCLARQGLREQLEFAAKYRIRVECSGSQVALHADDGAKLTTPDETYSSGCWGFRTVRTYARFSNIILGTPAVPRCFVVMPFTPPFDFVYEVIKQVVLEESIECIRVDEHAQAQPIINDIWSEIEKSDLLVADLTGRNPNVYYEAGVAHSLRKPVILLAQSADDLAFNLRDIRTVIYSTPDKLRRKLKRAIRDTFWEPRRSRDEST